MNKIQERMFFMKRILSLMLSLILLCGMFVPAVHAEDNNVYQVDITCPNWYTEMDPAKLVFEVQTPGFTLFRQPVLVYSSGPNSYEDETGMRRNDIEYYLAVGLNTELPFAEGDEIRVCLNGHMSDFQTTGKHLTETMEGCATVDYLNVGTYSELNSAYFDANGLDLNRKLSDLFFIYDFGQIKCDTKTTVYLGNTVDAPVMQPEDTFIAGNSYLFEVFARPQKMNQKLITDDTTVNSGSGLQFLADRTVTNDPADPDAVKLYFQYAPVVYYKIDKIADEDYRVYVMDAETGAIIDKAPAGTQIQLDVEVPPELEFDHWVIEGLTLSENMASQPGAHFYMPANDIKVIPMTRPASNPFTDVHSDDWFFRPVMWAYQKYVAEGVGEHEFAPRQWCNRAEAATMLQQYRIKNVTVDGMENPFTDVHPDDWFYNSIVWCYNQDLITGKDETTFAPYDTITRAQFVTMLWRNDGNPIVNSDSVFVDVPSDAYYYDAVRWAAEKGIVNGIDAEHFAPERPLNRAEATAMLYRLEQAGRF